MENPLDKWRFLAGKIIISMGHLYHGYVSHNQRGVVGKHKPMILGIPRFENPHTKQLHPKTREPSGRCCRPPIPSTTLDGGLRNRGCSYADANKKS